MRNRSFIPLVAAFMVGACGEKTQRTSDANAAEVSTIPTDTAGTPTPPPVPTGPVSFEDAHTAFKEKRYDEAVRLFTSYTAGKPDNVWGYYLLGLSAWKGGDPDGAVDAFTLALEKDSTHAKSRLNLSRVLIEQGEAQEALPHVEEVLRNDSTSSEAYRLLGRVRDELGDRDGAIHAFRRAIVLDERDAWSVNNLATVYINQGRFEDALGPLARVVEIDSTVATFHNNLGVALERTGHITQAAEAYQAALTIDSAYEKASVNSTRVDSLKQDSTVAPVDLKELARAFVEQVKAWQQQ
jgi:Flp pilus assembly protein TadD